MKVFFHSISSATLDLNTLRSILEHGTKLKLSKEAEKKIIRCRKYLEQKLKSGKEVIYGVNTGFGALCDVRISDDQLEQLQENLVLSHACGIGDEVPQEIVKLMLLLKIQSLSYGHSGVRLETVERLIYFYNHNILPVIYTQGSLGASGDLAPLAHLALPLIGKGKVNYKNKIVDSPKVLKEHKLNPLRLQSKEGLALLNGTQFMSAYGCYILICASDLLSYADFISAISVDAFDCKTEPFSALVHQIRPHVGQRIVAADILDILKGSEIAKQKKSQVQDPYSFRCIPQVHGASLDVVMHAENVFTTEINSVSDNPNIFPDEDAILSGGNFHGQPLALVLDYLCMAIAELGNISERRTFKLLSGERGLPAFLTPDSGLNSGMMILQYTAASIVSQNKQLCTPASVDSIVSSNGQEDHVSMGANAATKCFTVLNNLEKILAIELICSAQALDLRKPLKSSPEIEKFVKEFRKVVKPLKEDRLLHDDLEKAIEVLRA